MIPHWHVAFADAPGAPWWVRLLTPRGFRHVWAFGYDTQAGVWLLVEPTWTHTLVRAVPAEWVNAWLAKAGRDLTILRVVPGAERPRRPAVLVTCAGSIAMLLGLPACQWRPNALYVTLRARGAVEVR
jgi:hypothetical protein